MKPTHRDVCLLLVDAEISCMLRKGVRRSQRKYQTNLIFLVSDLLLSNNILVSSTVVGVLIYVRNCLGMS